MGHYDDLFAKLDKKPEPEWGKWEVEEHKRYCKICDGDYDIKSYSITKKRLNGSLRETCCASEYICTACAPTEEKAREILLTLKSIEKL